MLVLIQGKTLKPGDLGLNVRDTDTAGRGTALIDPAYISYSIFAVDPLGTKSLVTAPKTFPVRACMGSYFVNLTVPTSWSGKYELVWYLVQFPGSPEHQVFEEFEVVTVDPATTSFEAPSMLVTSRPSLNRILAERIRRVREMISDENPDRNYHFAPPTAGRTVAEFNRRVGFIWTDSTIISGLRFSIQQINTWNPMALYHYTVESAPPPWAECNCLGAAVRCLSKEAARWAEEGGWNYSLNGVSLGIDKQAAYQSLSESLRAEYTEWLPLLTANRPYSAGLRQQRYLLG
jgi:hypothetical protein